MHGATEDRYANFDVFPAGLLIEVLNNALPRREKARTIFATTQSKEVSTLSRLNSVEELVYYIAGRVSVWTSRVTSASSLQGVFMTLMDDETFLNARARLIHLVSERDVANARRDLRKIVNTSKKPKASIDVDAWQCLHMFSVFWKVNDRVMQEHGPTHDNDHIFSETEDPNAVFNLVTDFRIPRLVRKYCSSLLRVEMCQYAFIAARMNNAQEHRPDFYKALLSTWSQALHFLLGVLKALGHTEEIDHCISYTTIKPIDLGCYERTQNAWKALVECATNDDPCIQFLHEDRLENEDDNTEAS